MVKFYIVNVMCKFNFSNKVEVIMKVYVIGLFN